MHTPEEIAQLLRKGLSNITLVQTSGGEARSRTYITIPGVTGRFAATCGDRTPKGEAIAFRDDNQQWWVYPLSPQIQEDRRNLRMLQYQVTRPPRRKEEYKVPVLFYKEEAGFVPCTCPTYSMINGDCKEVCDGTGAYKNLADCLRGGMPGQPVDRRARTVRVYASAGPGKWHQRAIREKVFYIFSKFSDGAPYGSYAVQPWDSYLWRSEFLNKMFDSIPEFPASITGTGKFAWRGLQDLQAIDYSAPFLSGRGMQYSLSPTEPEGFDRQGYVEFAPYNYWVYLGDNYGESREDYFLGHYGQYAGGYVSKSALYNQSPSFGIASDILHRDIENLLTFLNTNFSNRLDGANFDIDFIIDNLTGLPLGGPPPPAPTYKPPDNGKKVFYLGGELERPMRLLELNLTEPHSAWLSSSHEQNSLYVTIKHGVHRQLGSGIVDLFCRIWRSTIPVPLSGDLPTPNIYIYPEIPPINDFDWRDKITSIYKLYPVSAPNFESPCKQLLWQSKGISWDLDGTGIIYVDGGSDPFSYYSFEYYYPKFNIINPLIKSEQLAIDLILLPLSERFQFNQCFQGEKYTLDRINVFPLGRPGEENKIWILALAPYKTI